MRSRPFRRPLALGLVLVTAALLATQLWAEDEETKNRVRAEINPGALAALMRARVSFVVLDARGAKDTFLQARSPVRLTPPRRSFVATYPTRTR